ncbi:FAD-binding oxidoreductase [Iamia sp. SCSIO 61187]|uniref:FAD-dependent oxidoreductase n=1 Tax=Iamia sp. SCSIO 61187 TaxID=2722752 RepID=UPI001C6390DF|nr:FAD-binding oxidoreductase [Iamia sp. SCSIO 61187]QYG92659.1 FAD-binding oxidoreductase [Iamia sp. SCSIO 61187]
MRPGARRELAGWGRTTPSAAEVLTPVTAEEAAAVVAAAPRRGVVARGLGRSYGDAAQNAGGAVIDATAFGGVLAFDEETGLLTVSAGTSLEQLMRWLVPRGWFVPVTPGTRHVTVGGAIASDIHGKNHHRAGTWCAHVRRITMATPADGPVTVSPDVDADLFWATAGGMGLTGVVLDATVQMSPIATSRAIVDTDRTDTLADCMDLLSAGDADYEYTVAWVDLLPLRGQVGRSVITRGRFAEVDELPAPSRREPLAFGPQALATVPPIVPGGLLNRWTVQAFNEAWFRKAPRRRSDEIQSISRFFHPLDGIDEWNRLHGPRGFLQWQIVVPFGAEDVLHDIADAFAAAKVPTLIGVLKRFGAANPGPLSFPIPGWTLSLDIPAAAHGLGPLLDRLDAQVVEAGGRIYLAKDSRVRPELMPVMYPRLDEWRAVRRRVDPDAVLQSDLGRRLGL